MTTRLRPRGNRAGPVAVPQPRRPHPASPLHALVETAVSAGRDARQVLTVPGFRGAVVETGWVTLHMALYPWGLVREDHDFVDRYGVEDLPPARRALVAGDVEAAGTPILLVHGMIENRAIFTVLKRQLLRRGFRRVITINYSPLTNDIRAAARELSGEIEALVALTGYERIHVVGHSLGGLIARYYVQRLGGDERVHTLVTLGTPHSGSEPARLLPFRLFKQLTPGSDLYTELACPARRTATRFVAYWSDLDQFIVPHTNARLEHPDLSARNVLVHATGHMALPINGRVAHQIAALLSQLDTDGSTLRPGVTSLPSPSVAR